MDTVFTKFESTQYGQLRKRIYLPDFVQVVTIPSGDDTSSCSSKAIKRGILPYGDLVCFILAKMSEVRRSQRFIATDFSIARILAKDEAPPSSSPGSSGSSAVLTAGNLPLNSPVLNCLCCPVPLLISTPETNPLDNIGGYRTELCASAGEVDVRSVNSSEFIVHTSAENSRKSSSTVSQDSVNHGSNDLPWLHCTRYRPPRLPKRSSAGKISKRRPGKHPRIPFTAFQLQILEDKYRKGAYLARRDVVQLSLILRLPQSRVKIWFQNRRARERRESLQSGNEGSKSDADLQKNDT